MYHVSREGEGEGGREGEGEGGRGRGRERENDKYPLMLVLHSFIFPSLAHSLIHLFICVYHTIWTSVCWSIVYYGVVNSTHTHCTLIIY